MRLEVTLVDMLLISKTLPEQSHPAAGFAYCTEKVPNLILSSPASRMGGPTGVAFSGSPRVARSVSSRAFHNLAGFWIGRWRACRICSTARSELATSVESSDQPREVTVNKKSYRSKRILKSKKLIHVEIQGQPQASTRLTQHCNVQVFHELDMSPQHCNTSLKHHKLQQGSAALPCMSQY